MIEFILIISFFHGDGLIDHSPSGFFKTSQECVAFADSYETQEQVDQLFKIYPDLNTIKFNCSRIDPVTVYKR